MKSFRNILSEVDEPKAGDEKHFKDKHITVKNKHPVAGDNAFTGGTKKAPKRLADHEAGEDAEVYEGLDPVNKKAAMGKFKHRDDKDIDNDGDVDSSDKYLHARRKAITKAVHKEEAENLDEISRDTARSYIRKAMAHKTTGETPKKDRSAGVNLAGKKAYGIGGKAKVSATESVEQVDEVLKPTTDMGTWIKDFQKSDAPQFKGKSKEKRRQMAIAAKYGAEREAGMREEVEQLDELSPNTLHSYVKKAAGNLAGNAAVAAAQASSSMKKSSPDVKRNIRNRMRGISGASGRLADKANMAENAWEEVPMMMRQLQFIMFAAEEIMEYLDTQVDPEEWFQNKLAHIHDQMQTLQAYAEGDMRMMSRMGGMYREEVELDESITKMSHGRLKFHLNTNTPHGSYSNDEMKAERDRRLKAGEGQAYRAAKAGLSEATPTKKVITRALQGMKVQPKNKVSLKKAPWEKNEEVNEVTQSAIKKPVTTTDPDGKTRTVYRSTKAVDRDEHGQEKIKANESVELDEAFKVGMLKLNDGGSVILKKEDVDVLNSLFKSLSSTNRKKMESTAMKDKNGFNEILSFAREAM